MLTTTENGDLQYIQKERVRKVAGMRRMIMKEGTKACARNIHRSRGRREWKVVRDYVECAPHE